MSSCTCQSHGLCNNAHSGQLALESPQTVTDTINHTDPITVKLTLETNTGKLDVIEATPEHPFYALLEPNKNASGIWVNAGELQPNNWLRRANGETGIVKKLEWLTVTKRMYNLTVARDHTFFVGDGQWLVHNADGSCGVTYLRGNNRGLHNERNFYSFNGTEIQFGTGHAWEQSKHILDATGLTPGQVEQAIGANLMDFVASGGSVGASKVLNQVTIITEAGERVTIEYSAVRLPNGSYSVSTYYNVTPLNTIK